MSKEDKLIDWYQKAEHLWNKAAPGFKTRNKKDLAFTKWATDLKIPSKCLHLTACNMSACRHVKIQCLHQNISGRTYYALTKNPTLRNMCLFTSEIVIEARIKSLRNGFSRYNTPGMCR